MISYCPLVLIFQSPDRRECFGGHHVLKTATYFALPFYTPQLKKSLPFNFRYLKHEKGAPFRWILPIHVWAILGVKCNNEFLGVQQFSIQEKLHIYLFIFSIYIVKYINNRNLTEKETNGMQ